MFETKSEMRSEFPNKIGFDLKEIKFAREWLNQSKRKGRNIHFGLGEGDLSKVGSDALFSAGMAAQAMGVKPSDAFTEFYLTARGGGIVIEALDLGASFFFIKESDGRGLFGKRFKYHTLIQYFDGRSERGPTFKRFSLAVASIANIYAAANDFVRRPGPR